MRLKRLELFGFKSFADRTVLNFHHDLVGIVGPNGCGKSNVVDAARWVLGEQRPSSMRGGEMIDVIFKGSASRPALSVAEVTIVLDNSSGTLDDRGEEVAVTRRVYKSGEGEYLIDGARVRLKDVREMLYGTGLGSRGYSVLEQGRIDAILSANAVERRAVFEEAAGISRYRQRKKETESRLKRVAADQLRLDDVVGELEKRERSLKIQAGKARRFIEARDGWRVDGERLAKHQLHGLGIEIAAGGRSLSELESEIETRRTSRGEAETDVQAREKELASLTSELERTQSESAEMAGEIRALDERRTQLAARVEAWRASAEGETKRAGELDVRLGERRTEGEALDVDLEKLGASYGEAYERVTVLERESAELTANHQNVASRVNEKNAELLELFHDLTSSRNRVQHLEESLDSLAEREERSAERFEEARSEVRGAEDEETRAKTALANAASQLEAHEAARAACEREGDEIERLLSELLKRRNELELSAARISSRIESLRDWDRERQGLEHGARELLDAVESGDGPALAGALAGLFADHVATETRTARALDMALGARAQSLVVRSRDDARLVLEWLKEREGGRVSLVVPDALREGAEVAGGLPPELRGRDGVEGTLLSMCRPAEGFDGLARSLIGDVVLVRDVEVALALSADHPTLRFVTPEGDLVDAAGLQGGHVEVTQGPVGRRSSADELEEEHASCEGEREELDRRLDEERARRAGKAARLTELRESVRKAATDHSHATATVDGVRSRLEELERSAALLERECEGIAEERKGILDELEATKARLVELEGTYGAKKRELAELEESRVALEAERSQRTRDEGQARVEASELSERIDAAKRRRSDLERACRELADEVQRTTRLAQQHTESADAGVDEATRLASERDELLAHRGQLEERIMSLRSAEGAGREAIDTLRKRCDELTVELEASLDRVSQSRLEKQRLELARDEIARRAEEDFGSDAHGMLQGFEPEEELAEAEAMGTLESRVHALKSEMDRLGPVNLEAVEELEEVAERVGFLRQQRDDLNEARRSLEASLKKLNDESERRFVDSFEKVRAEFKILFRQLFGGGRAEIQLEEGVPVLEAGIDIVARPPGRETLPISLLSGGQRTLTALALLFSVFRTNASPFCILDEVDAALDDANIGRFLSMIEHNLGETQYVVVTHNKATMAACQRLYGVTMAIKGVSNVVSVELDDVDEFVPEATGTGGAGARPEGDVELIPMPPPELEAGEGAGDPPTGENASAETADDPKSEGVSVRS